jgi:hypothetical protein
MRLQLKSLGSGVEGDPYRANLPTYVTLGHDEAAKVIVVEIPVHAHPFTEKELADMPKVKHPKHGELHAPTADHLKTLHAWYDERYRERKGEFRAETV